VWQFFSGMTYYEPRLPCDATQIGRFRRVLGEAGVEQLLKTTIEAAVAMKAVKTGRVRARDRGHHGAGEGHRAPHRQPPAGDGPAQGGARWPSAPASSSSRPTSAKARTLRRKAGGYAHAKQFKRCAARAQAPAHDAGRPHACCARCAASHGRSWQQEPTAQATTELLKWLERAERIRTQQAQGQEQALRAARPRGRVHRQGQGPQALRVRRQGQRGRHPQATA
jgi:IS5 family transposase